MSPAPSLCTHDRCRTSMLPLSGKAASRSATRIQGLKHGTRRECIEWTAALAALLISSSGGGLYDRSVVILTSDHGEMLGEDRQWGHAYYLFPPVLQIPLVVHLPPALAPSAAVDVDAIAFSTDITPTIYAVLGYRPNRQTDLMGQSLIGASGADFTSRRRITEVVAASYGAVWGVLRHNGQHLYIVDANHGKEYAFERLPRQPWHAVQ